MEMIRFARRIPVLEASLLAGPGRPRHTNGPRNVGLTVGVADALPCAEATARASV